jgi:hypothetical protein
MTDHPDLGTCEHCGNDDATHLLALCSDCAFALPDPSDDEEHARGPACCCDQITSRLLTCPAHPEKS